MFLILLTFSSQWYTYESYSIEESCDWDLYFCEYYNPYPIYYTYKFKCNHHLNCPQNFKCCKHHCFRHKICQPYRKIPAKLLTPFVYHPDVADKPGVCDVKISCNLRFSLSLTRHFECLNDYACPDQYKCCYIDCWGHKACQPLKEVASTTTMTVPVESYMRNTTLEHTSPFPTALRNFTLEYNQTFVPDSISNESTATTASTVLQDVTVEPRVTNMLETGYTTTMHPPNVSNGYTYQPDDTVNTKSITISYDDSIVEEELYTGQISTNPESDTIYMENSTNSTTLTYVTVPDENISSSIKPKDYIDNNNITTNADSKNTMTIVTITNDSYQANNTIITTISYNAIEESFSIGNVSTIHKTDIKSMENTSSSTTLSYVTVLDQNISSYIKPNHYSEQNNKTTNSMNNKITNNNATTVTNFDKSTSIPDVSFIKEDFTDTTDNATMTTDNANKMTNVNNNISYNAVDVVKTDMMSNITTATQHVQLTTIRYEINASSIQEEDETSPSYILSTNITENPIHPIKMDYEDINIINSGDGDPEQILVTDDEDHYINMRGDEENDDKSIWF